VSRAVFAVRPSSARRSPGRRHPLRFSARKKGQVLAIDTATGAVKWITEGRAADQAAILVTASHVLIQTTGGDLVLLERSPAAYKEAKRYTLADSATWAVPVVLPDAPIVRDAAGIMKLVP
jgi:hypothetical protein